MQKKSYKSHLFVILFTLGFIPLKSVAINYTISFTGSGASTTVDSVIVQNITKGTSIIVPFGVNLNLTDLKSSTEYLHSDKYSLKVAQYPDEGKFSLLFSVLKLGIYHINVFSSDGKKVAGLTTELCDGDNLFDITLPKGIFFIGINGKNDNYSTKIVSQSHCFVKPNIQLKHLNSIRHKIRNNADINVMLYSFGDRLIYKGKSGQFCTLISDMPTENKNVNFEFADCRDMDGNYYSVLKLGTQIWMAENLRTTKFNDNTDIPLIVDQTNWKNQTSSAYCNYDNDENNVTLNGRLYNWYSVKTNKLAPVGWHVPSDSEWSLLESYLTKGGYNYDNSSTDNKIAKSLADVTNWQTSLIEGTPGINFSKNNMSCFSAFPCGNRKSTGFSNIGYVGYWWSTNENAITDGWVRYISYNNTALVRQYYFKYYGFSIRCIKD